MMNKTILSGKLLYIALLAFINLSIISCEKETPASPGNGGGTGGTGGGGAGGGGTTPPTVTDPDTYFIDEYQAFNGLGGYWHQQFTVGSTTTFVLRGASTYTADFAVFAPSQLTNFQNNQAFTGYLVFDNQFGTGTVTLTAGTYYVGVRNQTSNPNTARIELDKAITLPASDKATFVDNYLSAAINVNANNGYVTQAFTVQQGYRYFMDGCNSGTIEYWVIPAIEITNFTSGGNFQFYTQYHAYSTAEPGSHSMTLPAGNYYYVFRNTGTKAQALTYRCERWRVN